ncbi:pseudaminic acid cytidylyltransferase [Akkermansiaceae bacterium]|nr:pseudaminic acid cytidylyltransferase [Akkermansiaceae bacterium]
MRLVCIIPARGGSKRIPRKNVKPFLGRPIIEYSIQAALESNLFDEVIVSTDCPEIAEIGRECGATTPFIRPSDTASDFATTAEVLVHALDYYSQNGVSWDCMCCLYPTAPFCDSEVLRKGFELLSEGEAPAVLPVAEFAYPILRSLRINGIGDLEMNWPEYELTRSQDLVDAYHDAGQFYWIRVSAFRDNPRLMPPETKPLILSRLQVMDIDTPEDWLLAEKLFRLSHL